jgi:hypothetical protein
VRVHYNDGSHVDIPVYRKTMQVGGGETFEIASSVWRDSNPKGVNRWFNDRLELRSAEARDQMRILIRLLKAYCKHRLGYSLPSGFVLTVLVEESYWTFDPRLDRAFRNLISAIRNRLAITKQVKHPVVDENLAESGDPKCTKLQELLTISQDQLSVLDRANCRRSESLKAWKKVFNNTDFFDQAISDAETEEKRAACAAVASVAVMPKPYASEE